MVVVVLNQKNTNVTRGIFLEDRQTHIRQTDIGTYRTNQPMGNLLKHLLSWVIGILVLQGLLNTSPYFREGSMSGSLEKDSTLLVLHVWKWLVL